MYQVGTLMQWVGGAIGRIALSGILLGLFVVVVGVLPWELAAYVLSNPPAWLKWAPTSLVVIGLGLIWISLRFNNWSQRQRAIDDLAEELSFAIHDLLNRKPRPKTFEQVEQWEKDFRAWCDNVSKKLENRAFFTRADQLHFDRLGFVPPVTVPVNSQRLAWLMGQLALKFERLRDVINWTQQRRN